MRINRNFLAMSPHWMILQVAQQWDDALSDAILKGHQFCWLEYQLKGGHWTKDNSHVQYSKQG